MKLSIRELQFLLCQLWTKKTIHTFTCTPACFQLFGRSKSVLCTRTTQMAFFASNQQQRMHIFQCEAKHCKCHKPAVNKILFILCHFPFCHKKTAFSYAHNPGGKCRHAGRITALNFFVRKMGCQKNVFRKWVNRPESTKCVATTRRNCPLQNICLSLRKHVSVLVLQASDEPPIQLDPCLKGSGKPAEVQMASSCVQNPHERDDSLQLWKNSIPFPVFPAWDCAPMEQHPQNQIWPQTQLFTETPNFFFDFLPFH